VNVWAFRQARKQDIDRRHIHSLKRRLNLQRLLCGQGQDFAQLAQGAFQTRSGGELLATGASQFNPGDVDVEYSRFAGFIPRLCRAHGLFREAEGLLVNPTELSGVSGAVERRECNRLRLKRGDTDLKRPPRDAGRRCIDAVAALPANLESLEE
jgi:hypothetical protein